MGGIFSVFSGKRGREGALAAQAALDGAKKEAYGQIDAGTQQAGGYLNQISDLYEGNLGRYDKGVNAYEDMYGLNGTEGTSRFMGGFKQDPGYQFQQQQGLDALDRRSASKGMLNSGNNMADTIKFSQRLADQSYGNYFDRQSRGLSPYLNMQGATEDQYAKSLGSLASLYNQAGVNKANYAYGIKDAAAQAATNSYAAGDAAAGRGFNAAVSGAKSLASIFGGMF